MSVYKPAKSRFFHYDFVSKGRRFFGSTGVTSRRTAERVEEKKRRDAALGITEASGYTLDLAAGRWWAEVGQHKKSAPIIEYRLGIVVRLLGPLRLHDITTAVINTAIERRRGETYARAFDIPAQDGAPPRKAARYALTNDTVNSDIIKRLRPVLNRATRSWGVTGLPEIDWAELALDEKQTPIVHFPDEYLQAWADACGPTERLALELLMANGWRLGELFFPPQAFMPDTPGGPCVAINKRKGGKPMLAPLRCAEARQVAARVGIAMAAGLDNIWIERTAAGDLVCLKYRALQSRLRTAAERSGCDHERLIHSIRHHFGTDMLMSTGNLRLTQQLLGHADIKSTMVYAHALDAGLREAINSRNSPEAARPDAEFIPSKQPRRRA